jgi:hypothetical protein
MPVTTTTGFALSIEFSLPGLNLKITLPGSGSRLEIVFGHVFGHDPE